MHILICSPESNTATGNWVTATRYAHALEMFYHRVTPCYLPPDEEVLAQLVQKIQPDIVLLIHAYRSGWQLIQTRQPFHVPTVVMLSGTDVNEGLADNKQSTIIEQVMSRADALLSHNPLQIAQLQHSHPHLARRLHYIPPAIELGNAPYPLRRQHHFSADMLLFLCPASIRPVKRLVELIALCDLLPADSHTWQLAFCGPVLDNDYAHQFFNAIEQHSWAHYLGVIAPEAMPAALRETDVVLNNSSSEGLPNALIEAAVIGVPILARDIVGNRPVVEHGVNGLLYHDRVSFVAMAKKLIDDRSLRQRLSQPRADQYTLVAEARELNRVCEFLRPNLSLIKG